MKIFLLEIWILYILKFASIINADNSNVVENQTKTSDDGATSTSNTEILLTADIYAKLFKERRKEHQLMAKHMLNSKYETNFKLLNLAFEKIFQIINEKNDTLTANNYDPKVNGFPQINTQAHIQEAVTLTMENCCIAAESVLHFPEMSYRIFRKSKMTNWKLILNWCIDFVHALPHIIDESTAKLMELLQQEINEELRSETYTNPYYKKEESSNLPQQKPKKAPKKLKKGPHLSSGRNEL